MATVIQIPLVVQSPGTGQAVAAATVVVTNYPSASAATIYTAADGSATLAGSSYLTDTYGQATYGGNPLYLAPGTYSFQIQGAALTSHTIVREIVSGTADLPAGTPSTRTLGTGAQQAAPGTHHSAHASGGADYLPGVPPIGAQIPYSGQGDPSSGDWVIADGRLIDRTTYAAFFAATGHAYNAGVDPGSNKVKIPDKRGKKSIGAINMGSSAGAGANDNTHYQAARGSTYGEVNHVLSAPETAQHYHTTNFASGSDAPDHGHSLVANAVSLSSGSQGNVSVNLGSSYNVAYSSGAGFGLSSAAGGATARHAHTVIGTTDWGTNAGGGAHNNVDPCEADSYLVRIA